MILEQMLMGATSEGGYSPNAVKFDGANDYLTIASLTGIADSKSGIISFWMRVDFDSTNPMRILANHSSLVDINIHGSDYLNIICYNSAATIILDMRTTTALFKPSAKWIHILASWDLATTTTHLYVNDVSDKTNTTTTNDTIDYLRATTTWGVGSTITGGSLFGGAISELYFAPGQYLDFSNSANRRKFIDASGYPVSLGSDGSTPTGVAPIIYMKGDASAFGVNSGTGGNFTVNGTLEKASTTPATIPAYNAVDFDGTSDYLSKAAALTGAVDSKTGLCSFWVRFDGSGGSGYHYILDGRNTGPTINAVQFFFYNLYFYVQLQTIGGSWVINSNTASQIFVDTGSPQWKHILVAWDAAAGTKIVVYVDGVSTAMTVSSSSNATVGNTVLGWGVGATSAATFKLNGAISELYYAPNQWLDLSSQANREKFILNGAPVSLGSDGSLPTGTAPAIYLPNRAALVGTNAGSGGDFTINGAPKDANSTPVYYYAEPATFDGTNDYLTRGADLTGIADGKTFTLSFWSRKGATTGYLMHSTGNKVDLSVNSAGRMNFFLTNAAGTQICSLTKAAVYSASNVWEHTLISVDLATSTAQVYINNTAVTSIATLSNDTIDWTTGNYAIGSDTSGAYKWSGDFADVWFNTTYLDISQSANRAMFIDQTTLRPVPLGAKGELPTGSQPLLYLGRDYSNFQTNLGSGGNFTVTGALTRGTTSPSDVKA